MAYFALDAVEAGKGDALVVRWGDSEETAHLALIDGGPAGTYRRSLLPHLQRLAGTAPSGEQLPVHLRLAMVSHVDSDHIAGVLDVLDEVREALEEPRDAALAVDELWHNSFADLDFLADFVDDPAVLAALRGGVPVAAGPGLVALPESVREGRELSKVAERAGVARNQQGSTAGFIRAGASVDIDGLRLDVLAPDDALIALLREEWKKEVKKIVEKEAEAREVAAQALAASFDDPSKPNQSSIVVLATFDDKTMFLTGDARGDHLIEAVTPRIPPGEDHLDVGLFKLGHHGSAHSNGPTLFTLVRSEEYVISGNGEHGNPHPDVLEELFDTQDGRSYRIHVTNHPVRGAPPKFRAEATEAEALLASPPAGVEVCYRDDADLAITTQLS